MSKNLDEIREKIDSLDQNIHALLRERADLIVDVIDAKRAQNLPVVHPGREAQMMRRLLERHSGPLPESAILSIWRELVGAVCMMQKGLSVQVADNSDFKNHWDMAKNYFGSVVPLSKSATPLMAVAALRDAETSFAVLPWPIEGVDSGSEKPWWAHVFDAGESMQIVCALPYGYEHSQTTNGFLGLEHKAMILSRDPFLESGLDHTCFVVRTDHSVSRAKVVEVVEEQGLKPVSLHTKSCAETGDPSIHMVIVEGYKMNMPDLCDAISAAFQNAHDSDVKSKCQAIGGYPVPPGLNPVQIIGDAPKVS